MFLSSSLYEGYSYRLMMFSSSALATYLSYHLSAPFKSLYPSALKVKAMNSATDIVLSGLKVPS